MTLWMSCRFPAEAEARSRQGLSRGWAKPLQADSPPGECRHAEAAMGEAAVEHAALALPRTHGHEQGQEMLVARMGKFSLGSQAAVIHQAIDIARLDALGQPLVEREGPIGGVGVVDMKL